MNTTIRVGIYRDDDAPWSYISETMLPRGIEIQLIPFCSYEVLNMALNSGEIDLNCFQHLAFLQNEVVEHSYDLVAIAKTCLDPMGLYSNVRISTRDLQIGDVIVIPADPSNGARALRILNDAGIIRTDPEKGYLPNLDDIQENPLALKFVKADPEATIYELENPDVAAVFVMGDLAFEAGLHVGRDSLLKERVSKHPEDNPFFKVLVTRNTDKDRPEFKEIIKAYRSAEAVSILKNSEGGQLIIASEVM